MDTADAEEVERTLSYLSQLVARRLREHRLFARTIGLKLRNHRFKTVTRDTTLDEPTHLDSVIFEQVLRMFGAAWDGKEMIRLVGVRTSNLESSIFQRGLFDSGKREKLDRILRVADRVRGRYGFDALQLARSLDREKK